MTVYNRIFPFNNSGSYDSLLKYISVDNSGSYDCLLKDISFDNSGSYDSLLKDISSITQAHMTVY